MFQSTGNLTNSNQKVFQETPNVQAKNQASPEQNQASDIQQTLEESAVEVSISMGAQVILALMEATQTVKDNTAGQQTVLDFLSGKVVSDDFNLANTGYEGKPIDQLSAEEATALVEGDGFFSIAATSQRVSSFVLNLAGDNLENLEKAREGIIQGFKEAEKMWGGKLPEISYATQEKTLELIDEKLAELKGDDTTKQKQVDTEDMSSKSVDISI